MSDVAERALDELEAYYDKFLVSTVYGRRLELQRFALIRSTVVSATGADQYVMEKLACLSDVLRMLARERQPSNFDESNARVLGLGDLSNIRGQMATCGLVVDAVRPYVTSPL